MQAVGSVQFLHFAIVCLNACREYMVSGTCKHGYTALAQHGLLDESQPWIKDLQKNKRQKRKGATMSRKQAARQPESPDARLVSREEASVCGAAADKEKKRVGRLCRNRIDSLVSICFTQLRKSLPELL